MKLARSDGFSLVEVMVAMAIFAVLSSAIVSSITTSTRAFVDRRIEAEAQQDRRTVNYVLARTLREAGLDPLDKAGTGIEQALANRLTFSADYNLNGVLDANERMTFVFDPVKKNLARFPGNGSSGSGTVVAGNLTEVTFSYFDSSGNNLGAPDKDAAKLADIRSITVNITTEGKRISNGKTFNPTTRLFISCKNL